MYRRYNFGISTDRMKNPKKKEKKEGRNDQRPPPDVQIDRRTTGKAKLEERKRDSATTSTSNQKQDKVQNKKGE